MALQKVDWTSFLSPDSDLPPDVTFLVQGEDGRCSEIGAHRLLLSGTSPVFRRMFFGPMKETEEVMEVKETSPEAFRTMIDYIYEPGIYPEEILFDIKCPKTLFELFALSDRYDILNLKTDILDSLGEFEMTRENVIYAATVAKNYRELFVDLSTGLLMRCLKFFLDTQDKDNIPDSSLDVFHDLLEVGKSTLQLSGNQHLLLHS